MTNKKSQGHRWSGWPGAYCLDCGMEDQQEIAMADGILEPHTQQWSDEERYQKYLATVHCPEPNSKRFDPYNRKPPA